MVHKYHIPVLAEQTVEGLNIKPDGVYVDVTFGGGGHSKIILEKLDKGLLLAFDQDTDAQKNAETLVEQYGNEKFKFIKSNFRFIKNFLKYYNFNKVDGILADLGVSSHQFDTGQRGFSFMLGGELDMRMNTNSKISAKKIINEYTEEDLYRIFKNYGEIDNPYKTVKNLISAREQSKIETVEQLNDIVNKTAPKNKEYKFLAKLYQALRIETNAEMEALESFLTQTGDLVKVGGRLSILTYHSLEDRLVKNYIKTGNTQGETKSDFFGNKHIIFKAVNNKVIVPDENEIENNSRARSAKLRIAEKLNNE